MPRHEEFCRHPTTMEGMTDVGEAASMPAIPILSHTNSSFHCKPRFRKI